MNDRVGSSHTLGGPKTIFGGTLRYGGNIRKRHLFLACNRADERIIMAIFAQKFIFAQKLNTENPTTRITKNVQVI